MLTNITIERMRLRLITYRSEKQSRVLNWLVGNTGRYLHTPSTMRLWEQLAAVSSRPNNSLTAHSAYCHLFIATSPYACFSYTYTSRVQATLIGNSFFLFFSDPHQDQEPTKQQVPQDQLTSHLDQKKPQLVKIFESHTMMQRKRMM